MICKIHGNQWQWSCLECFSFGTVKRGTGYVNPTIDTPSAPAESADEKPDGQAKNTQHPIL